MKFMIFVSIYVYLTIIKVQGALVGSFVYFNGNNTRVDKPDNNLPLKIIVHGWNNYNANSDGIYWALEMKNAILENENYPKPNVLLVNWNSNTLTINSLSDFFSSTIYLTSANNCPFVAQEIIDELKKNNYKNSIHCIGHSLGAHVCGFAGKIAQRELVQFKRISGLDPAHPNFKFANKDQRLDKSDADFVDIYHTNHGFVGISYNIGHADFYPNDSSRQPGCGPFNLNVACSHVRSFEYYISSIESSTCFTVYNRDGSKAKTAYGYWATFSNGEYILTTDSKKPFCKA